MDWEWARQRELPWTRSSDEVSLLCPQCIINGRGRRKAGRHMSASRKIAATVDYRRDTTDAPYAWKVKRSATNGGRVQCGRSVGGIINVYSFTVQQAGRTEETKSLEARSLSGRSHRPVVLHGKDRPNN